MILNSPYISGSLTVTGNIITSGSITISGSIASASYATNAELLDGLDSTVFTLTSSFNTTSASLYTVSSSAYVTSGSLSATSGSLSAASGSLSATSASLSAASGSFNTRVSALEATGSALSSSLLTVSGSGYATSASLSTSSGSFNSRVATIESKYATTGSNTFIGTQVVSGSILQSGSFTSTGTLTAQTLVVQTVTSSVVYSSGSNVFGNSIGNSQTFTGSVLITGSLTISTGGNVSAPTIFGSTIACSPIGCFATSCATSFIGGTMSGTTIYGSTAVCSANGLLIGNGGVTATCNYLPKFTGASTIGNSSASDNGTTFDVSIQGKFTGASGARILTLNAPTDGGSLTFETGGTAYADIGSNKAILGTGSATNFYIGTRAGSSLAFGTANTARLFLDTSGNLGLGVTPSAWGTITKGFQIGNRASVFTYNNLTTDIGNNTYFNGTNYIYIESDYSTFLRQNTGQFQWLIAPSGTAGNAITFTQAMTLTASGFLGVGTASPSEKLHIYSSASSTEIRIENSTTSAYIRSQTDNLNFYFNSAERMRIFSSGNVAVGTTTDSGYKLDVNGTGRFSGDLKISGALIGGDASFNIGINYNTGGTPQFAYYGGTTAEKFKVTSTGAATFSGNIGVGGGTPSIFTAYSVASFGSLSTTNNGITIASTTAGNGLIEFADGTAAAAYRGYIQYAHTSDSLAFGTAGSDRLTIASTGAATFSSSVTANDFIIGSYGNFKVQTNTSSVLGYLLRSGTWKGNTENNLALATDGAYGIAFYTNGSATEKMFITSGGNVGIGTTTPISSLMVSKTLASNQTYLTLDNKTNSKYNWGIDWAVLDSTNIPVAAIRAIYPADNNISLGFYTYNDSGFGERVRINKDGNVGIGTSSPGGGSAGTTSTGTLLDIYDGTAVGNNGGALVLSALSNSSRKVNLAQVRSYLTNGTPGSETGDMIFSTMTAATLAEKMRITSGGNVEIANGYLSTSAGSGTSYSSRLSTVYTYPYIDTYLDSIGGTSYNGRLRFRTSNGGGALNDKMIIYDSGAVVISGLAGSGTRSLNVLSDGTLSPASDSKLKQEDKEYTIGGLKELLQITPRAYKWLSDIEKRGKEAITELGFFADEVAPIIPSAAPKGNDDMYGFYDRALMAVMVKSIQELTERLIKLESK